MILDDLANYTKSLLSFGASLIVIARESMRKTGNDVEYIVIDELVSIPDGTIESFNGDTEQQEFTVQFKGSFTLNFFGTNARANAVKWQALHKSQSAYELQRDLGFAVFHTTNFRNLKALEGSQYNERYEIEVSLTYNETEIIDTLRIDTAQTDIIVSN